MVSCSANIPTNRASRAFERVSFVNSYE